MARGAPGNTMKAVFTMHLLTQTHGHIFCLFGKENTTREPCCFQGGVLRCEFTIRYPQQSGNIITSRNVPVLVRIDDTYLTNYRAPREEKHGKQVIAAEAAIHLAPRRVFHGAGYCKDEHPR